MTQIKKENAIFLKHMQDLKQDEILLIPTEKLILHPEYINSSTDDISELTEHIRKNGVLENFIIVPCAGHYYGKFMVISSYRQFIAARAAGTPELPCRVVHMNEPEQLDVIKLYR